MKPQQANLLQRCPEHLTPHEGKDGAAALQTLTKWPAEYNDCAARHNKLIDALEGKK